MLLLTTKAKDIKVIAEDWPRCDQCDMPVEEFCVTDTGDALILVATCHKKEETVTLTDDMWDNVNPSHVDIGPAFLQTNEHTEKS